MTNQGKEPTVRKLSDVPKVDIAWVAGSGTWGFRFPEGVLGDDDDLDIKLVERGLVYETPYGDSPPFGLYELTRKSTGESRRFLRVWFHGVDPKRNQPTPEDALKGTSFRASERVFSVLRSAETKWVLVDATVGGINDALDVWDLVIPHDYYDDMKRVSRVEVPGSFNMRQPHCPDFRKILVDAAAAHMDEWKALAQELGGPDVHPKIVKRGICVSEEGWWFSSAANLRDYARRGFDIITKTNVPEVYLARSIGAHFATINPVSNPAEGRLDPDTRSEMKWDFADIYNMYDRCGPVMARIVLTAIDAIPLDEEPDSEIRELGRSNRFSAFYRPANDTDDSRVADDGKRSYSDFIEY